MERERERESELKECRSGNWSKPHAGATKSTKEQYPPVCLDILIDLIVM